MMHTPYLWKRVAPAVGLLTVLVLVLFGMSFRPAAAAGIVVNTTADNTTAGDGLCTLREAITNANSDSDTTSGDCAAGFGADTITFAANTIITLAGSQLPAVTTEMTIIGNGAANTIIQASTCNPVTLPGGCTPADYRVFEATTTGKLTLDGVTVRHGHCAGACATSNIDGGGILNDGGMLTVTSSTLSGNSADFGFGGGIFNSGGMLTVTNSTLSGNSAARGGGIFNYEGEATVTNSTLSGNSANDYGGFGGGIFNSGGTLTVTNSTLSGNSVNGFGGGIANEFDGEVTVTNSTLSDNSATRGGGGGIFIISGEVTVTGSTFSGNSADFRGAGGGIRNEGGGTLTVTNSTLFGNSADSSGGGIFNSGTLTVTNSTLSGNSATFDGGGIRNYRGEVRGEVTVTGSTLSGNSAGRDGGGIYNERGTLQVTNSTLSSNTATSQGGGIFNTGSGTATLTRSLISGNSAAVGDEIYRDTGTINVNAFNVFGHSGLSLSNSDDFVGFVPGASDVTATSDEQNVALANILSTTLAENGGPTQTHALVPGSPAIDLAPSAACAAAPVNGLDQRGEPRNVDGDGIATANECDTGAFEYQLATAPPTATPSLEPTATTTPTPTPTTTQTPEATATPAPQPPVYLPVVTGE